MWVLQILQGFKLFLEHLSMLIVLGCLLLQKDLQSHNILSPQIGCFVDAGERALSQLLIKAVHSRDVFHKPELSEPFE
jgi:hypothetical protein